MDESSADDESRDGSTDGDSRDGSAGGDTAQEQSAGGSGTRERFWDFVCKYAIHFYVLLLMVTVFLVMNVLVLALVPASSLSSTVRTGSLIVVALNFVILLTTAGGIIYILRVCDRYTTPASDDEAL